MAVIFGKAESAIYPEHDQFVDDDDLQFLSRSERKESVSKAPLFIVQINLLRMVGSKIDAQRKTLQMCRCGYSREPEALTKRHASLLDWT